MFTFLRNHHTRFWASQVTVVKNLPADAGHTGDVSLISGLGIYHGGGHGNPL